ncbi:MAG: T9SS type A sorting domain-containing protein [Bacteroidetes bacterium]|nr:T9SS type A sorting domain-containing protein [Bacteroidota bacterium]
MSAIRIDAPCHENWQEMTPTERGAFCQKCSIDVYDFSKMNLSQIKLVLKENAGKHLCGRFEKQQMQDLNTEFDAWKQNQPATFQSRFVFALLLVFGLTLFSCEEEDAKKIASLNATELKSSLAASPMETDQKLADQLFFFQDAIIADAMIPLLEDELIEEVELHIMGEMMAPPADVTNYEEQRTVMVAGGPMISHEYINYLDQTVDTNSKTTLADPVYAVYNPFETELYPNPTADISKFSIYIHETAQFLIEVYAINGQKITEIHHGDLAEGRHNFNIDLTDFNAGTYFVKVWSAKQQETVKVMKVD